MKTTLTVFPRRTTGACLFLLATLALSPVLPGADNITTPWTLYETAQNTDHRLSQIPLQPAASPADAKPQAPALTLNPAKRYQEMIGFGGALTESSAWVLAQLPAEKRLEVLRRYYDPAEGIGYTIARTHMNSCDFSLSMWSLDDTPGDYDLHDFTLAPMRRWVIPLLHDAQTIANPGNFKLLVSPWSPPFWMKTNYRMDDGGSLRPEYAPAWADFYVRFAQALQKEENLSVWAFTVQNEPEAHQTWESCLYTPDEERNFVRDILGPTLARAKLDTIKLVGWDHNRDRIEARANAIFGDPASTKYYWGIGVHWYVSDDYAASSRVHEKFPTKPIIFTEGCCESGDNGANLGLWSHGEGYATSMIGDFKNWVATFIDWNIVLDQRGGPNHVGNFCDAPVIVNTDTKEISYSAAFYYIAHFSRFVKPGAHRIETTGVGDTLQTIAFANPDGSLVAIVLNTTGTAQTFALKTTSTTGAPLTCAIPAHAIQTYVAKP